MHSLTPTNFAYEVFLRSRESQLIDAVTGRAFPAANIARMAKWLYDVGMQPGDFLILSSGIDPESALAYLGAIYAGVIPIPVADADLGRYLPLVAGETGARFLWTKSQPLAKDLASVVPHLIQGFSIDECGSIEPALTKPTDLAVLMPTSGSTGIPKLVEVTHENLLVNSLAIVKSQDLIINDRAMLIMPISYCFGASILHTHLLAGGDIILDRRMMFPDKVLDSIDQYKCTTFAGVPSVFKTLLRSPRLISQSPMTLRKILQAGGPLEPSSVRRIRELLPQVKLFVMYGQTEATARICTLDPSDCDAHPDSVGKPIEHVEIRVVTEDGSETQSGEIGEIWVRGKSVTRGYWRNPEATQAKFVNGWLRTGDLGRADEHGFLTITGRKDSFVKIRGLRVALGEIESLAQQVPEIEEAAACCVPHEQLGEAVILFLVLSPECSLPTILGKLRTRLPPQWRVDRVYAVDQLPKTSNNKINRSQLQALAERTAA